MGIPLALIASVSRNGSIGHDNGLVWDEPADKRWFRQQTAGCPVIMGRKTWDSLPPRFRPLPGRDNIVVSRQAGWSAAGATVAATLADALVAAQAAAAARQSPRIFVIGGGQLYGQALPLADQLVLTEIDADLPGDIRFPAWNRQDFAETERLPGQSAQAPGTAFAFVTYQRLPMHTTPLRCGAWPSPLTPEAAAAGAVQLAYAGAAGGRLHWVEGRPAEQGRSVLMALGDDGAPAEVLGADANVRSRVHEYGGTPWVAVGGRIVYTGFADQRLRVWSATGGERLLTPPGCRHADAQAAPDGRHLVCVREDHRDAGEPRNQVLLLDLDGDDGGEGRVLFGDSDFVAWPRLSPCGTRLAFVAWDHPAMPWESSRLMLGTLREGVLTDLQAVAGGAAESVAEPQWAADGSLLFLSDRSGWNNLCRWQAGQITALTALADGEIGGPLWNLGQCSQVPLADGRVLLRVGRGAIDQLALLDTASGALTPLPLPFVAFGAIGLLDAHTAHATAAAADRPPVLITIDLRDGSHRVVRAAGPAPLDAAFVSAAEPVEFTTAPGPDGEARRAHAWFYPPRHPGHTPPEGEAPPLIVMMHGGPTAHVSPAFKAGVQFWTTRGFAVVDVNYGGSSGFGRAYRERLRGQWGVVDLQDAVAAVDHLAASGRVDGARVAIRGGSAGGFTVLSALAFTRRFAAGINYFGVADLETLATDTHKFESRYLDGLVAPLPAGRDTYRARSPVHHMAQCRAALITFQGSDDRAVPPQQSRDIVAAARAAGCPVAYLEFEGEGHGFRQGPNIVRAMQAELVFLGQVFGHTPAEAGLPAVAIDNVQALPGR